MRSWISWGSMLAAALAAGCSSVELPAERFFALALVPATPTAAPAVDVLRVFDLQPTGAIDRDYPIVVDGVQLGRNEFDRWIVPVDRLITDALVVGLSRRGVATLVKGGADPGRERWALQGRILEFAAVRDAAGNSAQVTLELWLMLEDRPVFRNEFHAAEPILGEGTVAVVAALSRGLEQVIANVERRLRAVPQPTDSSAVVPLDIGTAGPGR